MDSNTNFNQNSARVYTGSAGGELYISTTSSKQTILASNNRAQYYADQAKEYRDEAKQHRDNAKFYAEQNSDVTVESINNMKAELLREIDTKQDSGDYALKDEIPVNLSELNNDTMFATTSELQALLPTQENCSGRFLTTDGENMSWQGLNTFSLFDTKISDRVLSYEETKGWALQGTYVYKEALLGTRYGYPDFYNKCIEEKESATAVEVNLSGTTVTMYKASNGHQYYDISDKTIVDNYFNVSGYAWFYGVDTENECIFLPRNNWFEQLTVVENDVNKTVIAGLPNITGQLTETLFGSSAPVESGALYQGSVFGTCGTGGSANKARSIAFNASRSNSIYGKSSTVQPKAVKKLLYICVGNTINYECMTEVVNSGVELIEQLNQGLESRVNLDASNLSSLAKSLISGLSMPSAKTTNLTLGATGSSYTAPANGWFVCACTGTAGSTYFEMVQSVNNISATASFTGGWGRATIPVKKGDVVAVYYGGNGFTKQLFRFVYAQGEIG